MQISISILLVFYLIMTLFFLVFSLFLVYHALRFGVASLTNVLTLGTYLAVSALILGGSYLYILSVDWSQAIKLF